MGEIKEIRQKYDALMLEKKRMKKERTKLNRRNKFLESFAAQMTIENLKVNQRMGQMDRKLEGCTEEIERQNQMIEGLRAENLDLLERVSRIDTVKEGDDITELMDQCIQVDHTETVYTDTENDIDTETAIVDITEDIKQMSLPEMEDKGIMCGGVPEEEEGEDLLTLIQQYEEYEDHEDYLQYDDEKEEHEDQREEDTETRNKEKLLTKLVMEGIQREKELNESTKSSELKRRGIWDFFTSRIGMRWI